MKNSTLIVAGLGIAAVAAFLIYTKKTKSDSEQEKQELQKRLAELESQLGKSKEEATTQQEKSDVEEAEKLLEEAETIENTPEGKSKGKKIAEKLGKIARRSPVGVIVRANIAVIKKVGAIAKEVGKGVSKAIDKMEAKGEIRRECRKEADDKFGFPIRPKKIKEKVEYRKKCKQEGGNDDFASFSSDLLSNEGEIFAFNGHTF
jgi:hypothetical protein